MENPFKTIKLYLYYLKRKAGKKTIEYRKGCGYYFPVGYIGYSPIGKTEVWEMKSGKTAVVQLIDYRLFGDPDDMIKESFWQLLGFNNEKPISKCSWQEFRHIYGDYLTKTL